MNEPYKLRTGGKKCKKMEIEKKKKEDFNDHSNKL